MEFNFSFIAVVGEQDGKQMFAPANRNSDWNERPGLRFASLDAALNTCIFTTQTLREYLPHVARFSVRETARTGILMMPEQLEPGSEAILMDRSGKFYQKGKGFITKSYLKAEHFTSREELRKVLKDIRPMTTEIVILRYKKMDVLCDLTKKGA